jgi:hypothetical protein
VLEDVGGREAVVGVFGCLGGDVDDDGWRDELLQRNLIDGDAVLVEVDRRVEVRAAVLRRCVEIGRVEVAARRRPVRELLQLEAARRIGPVKRVLVEGVTEVDEVVVREVDRRRGEERSEEERRDQHAAHISNRPQPVEAAPPSRPRMKSERRTTNAE